MPRRLVLPLIALAACDGAEPLSPPVDEPTEVLDIDVDRDVYERGDPAVVTVVNKTADRVVAINLCERAFDRWDGAWRQVLPPPAPGMCPQIFSLLRPGQTARGPLGVSTELSPGLHRMRFITLADTATGLLPERERVTPAFEVR